MGTNYYLHQKPDWFFGHAFEPLHIGKSSGGWCFSLHVIPEDGINNPNDWRELWNTPGAFIRNEYGERVSAKEMERIVTDRSWHGSYEKRWPDYLSEIHFHEANHSERGPNGLLRHRIGRYCTGHGAGTWDYMLGEFS